jgi:hypothetical protein
MRIVVLISKAPYTLAATFSAALAVLGGMTVAAQDKYTVQVPNGLALSECRGYEDWPAVAVSHPEEAKNLLVIVANPAMIEAYRAGVPDNGEPFPDGSRIAKITWRSKQNPEAPFPVLVPDALAAVGCMVKDSGRFSDSGGWGWGQFNYDTASDTFAPDTEQQANDAQCGFACHSIVEAKDYVFTAYGKR